jgi:hypothetical protein
MVRLDAITGEVELLNDEGVVLWSGRPLGYPVSAALPINGSSDCIVLCNPDAQLAGVFRNLIRVSANGAVVWRADLPARSGNDSYVAVQWAGPQLVANTWTAYSVHIDANSGQIISAEFTK